MKSKDFQNLVLSKYQSGDGPTKIFRDLNGLIGLRTIERWCKNIRDTGSINLSSPPGCHGIIRTKGAIQKVKNRLEHRKPVSSRKVARDLDEKMFDIDGIYNSQNDRIWAVNRLAADTNGGIRQK
ncbi:unnamed protein product, partial [Rotaria magnacalcarata]